LQLPAGKIEKNQKRELSDERFDPDRQLFQPGPLGANLDLPFCASLGVVVPDRLEIDQFLAKT
jgi:hypothetical protein